MKNILQSVFGRGKSKAESSVSAKVVYEAESNINKVARLHSIIPEIYRRIADKGANKFTFIEDTSNLVYVEKLQGRYQHATWLVTLAHNLKDDSFSEQERDGLRVLGQQTFDRFNVNYAGGVVAYFDTLKEAIVDFDKQHGTKFEDNFFKSRTLESENPGSSVQIRDVLNNAPVYIARPLEKWEEERVTPGEREVRISFGPCYPVIEDMFQVSHMGEHYAKLFSNPKSVDSLLRG